MKRIFLALASVVLSTGCVSTTILQSNPPDAKVLIDGSARGQTPYTHSETVTAFTHHAVTIQKDGYKDVNGLIAADQWQAGKLVASILCFLPGILFSTEYPPTYNYNLERAGAAVPATSLPRYDPDGLLAATTAQREQR